MKRENRLSLGLSLDSFPPVTSTCAVGNSSLEKEILSSRSAVIQQKERPSGASTGASQSYVLPMVPKAVSSGSRSWASCAGSAIPARTPVLSNPGFVAARKRHLKPSYTWYIPHQAQTSWWPLQMSLKEDPRGKAMPKTYQHHRDHRRYPKI